MLDTKDGRLQCDMRHECKRDVTHIGNRGFIYCATHAEARGIYEQTRRLTRAEADTLRSGKPVERF